MALHDKVALLRQTKIANEGDAVPKSFQGITKEKIRTVLTRLDLGSNVDLIDGVFALLDDQNLSWFSTASHQNKFCDGATTAQLACHIGILQRGNGKLDREGRDYWIKPLRELGGIEPVLLHNGSFIYGHVVPKSPNSAYRLSADFKVILQAPPDQWESLLKEWSSKDALRGRRELQAEMAELSRQLVDTGHSDLIRVSVDYYAKHFLPGYEVVYIDDGDGDRITDEDREKLKKAGLDLKLGDAMPDALLWNPESDRLWIIEAVTSDGEVDQHKVNQLVLLAKRCGKAGVDFTTSFRTWKEVASRQGAHRNIAIDTYLWIQEDPGKHFLAQSFS